MAEAARSTRIAGAEDLGYVLSLAARFTEQIGFIPKAAVEEYVKAGRVWLCAENEESSGYLLSRPALEMEGRSTLIVQAAVQVDARRRHHALALLESLRAQGGGGSPAAAVHCWCRGDLDSIQFWAAAGLAPIAVRAGGAKRGIPQVLFASSSKIALPSRRHGKAGLAVALPGSIDTDQIVSAARDGQLPRLLCGVLEAAGRPQPRLRRGQGRIAPALAA